MIEYLKAKMVFEVVVPLILLTAVFLIYLAIEIIRFCMLKRKEKLLKEHGYKKHLKDVGVGGYCEYCWTNSTSSDVISDFQFEKTKYKELKKRIEESGGQK